MPVGKRRKNGRTQWCADYTDSAGRRVQKFRPTKELADEVHAQGVLQSRQKTTPGLPTTPGTYRTSKDACESDGVRVSDSRLVTGESRASTSASARVVALPRRVGWGAEGP